MGSRTKKQVAALAYVLSEENGLGGRYAFIAPEAFGKNVPEGSHVRSDTVFPDSEDAAVRISLSIAALRALETITAADVAGSPDDSTARALTVVKAASAPSFKSRVGRVNDHEIAYALGVEADGLKAWRKERGLKTPSVA